MVSYKKHLDIEIFDGKISKHQYPWHFHDCYTLVLVEKGSIVYEFQDQNINVDATEVLIIEPNKIHRNTISKDTAYKAIFLPLEYFEQLGQNKLLTQKINHPNVVHSILDFLSKIALNDSQIELKEIVFGLCETITHPQIEMKDLSPLDFNIIPKIDYDKKITELANAAHLSKYHFQRKFKKNCGMTIGQLKQQERTIKAKTLIESGKLSIDVAYELGFFDQSHFIKYFKKMWATTPKNL